MLGIVLGSQLGMRQLIQAGGRVNAALLRSAESGMLDGACSVYV
jgi:hypothetical protein